MFRVLGPLEVTGDAGPISIPGERPRALLTALLLHPGSVVSIDRLVDALWGEAPPESPTNALQQVVTRLRVRLGSLGGHLETRPGGYLLRVPADGLDADVFESLCAEAKACASSRPDRAGALLDEALGLWRGTAYAELANGIGQPASVRLEELRIAVLEDRAALHLAAGEHVEAVGAARALVAADPLRERPVELLAHALHTSGRTPEALDALREHREALAEELGLDPSSALQALHTRILQDDLAPPAPAEARRPTTSKDPGPAAQPELPWRVGTLLGREAELAQLRACLGEQQLLTLVGPGGVGKTRLALEAAHLLADEGRCVWWADLSSRAPEQLLDALAEACGTEIPRGPDPWAVFVASLHVGPGLLVLDNAESMLDEVAPLVERLMAAVPELRVLATSRERLAVTAEHAHLLGPLLLPSGPDRDNPAIRLFLSHAQGLEPDDLSEDDLADIGELCRRLDGLPLAIELGAARANTFGVREFTAQVGRELDLLSGGRRTASSRHRTLRAVVDASYALLSQEEATLLARLSAFPGSFDLAQARSVCADDVLGPAVVTTALARLVEQSLVQGAGGRFWLLQTLRTYASALLEEEERRRLRAAHARDVSARLRAMSWQQTPSSEPDVVRAIARMAPDLHAAWDYAVTRDRALAVELAANVYDFAYPRQRRDLLEWGLVVAGWRIEHPDLPRALATAATAAWADGDLLEAAELARRGLDAATGEDAPGSARSMAQAGNLAMFAGRSDEAVALFERSQQLYLAAGERTQSLMVRMAVCQARVYSGEAEEAASRLRDLLVEAEEMGNPSALSWVHYLLGEALADSDVEAASAAYRTAVDQGRRADNRLFVMLARSALANLAAQREAPGRALEEFESVLQQWSDLRNAAAQWGVLAALVSLLVRIGDLREATVLAGAVRGNRDRQPLFERQEPGLIACEVAARAELGAAEAERLLSSGARMSIDAALAQARRAIRVARGS